MSDDDKRLVLVGGNYLLAILAAILGIASPFAGGVAGATAVIGQAVAEVVSRRESRSCERLTRIVSNLEARLRNVEIVISNDDERVDLFVEVVRKAVEDDENRKEVYYTGLLEWISVSKPPLSQVRVLSDAVRSLSFTELTYFIFRCNGRSPRTFLERELAESIALSRLAAMGVTESGIVHINGGKTVLGGVLVKYCGIKEVFELLTEIEQRAIG